MVCLMSSASTPNPMPQVMTPLDAFATLQLPLLPYGTLQEQAAQSQFEALLQQIGLNTSLPMEMFAKIETPSTFAESLSTFIATSTVPTVPTVPSSTLSTPVSTVGVPQIITPGLLDYSNAAFQMSSVSPSLPPSLPSLPSLPSMSSLSTPLSTHSLGFQQMYMDELNLPSTSSSYNRRRSAPEDFLRPPIQRVPEKRRFSDFSIDALLHHQQQQNEDDETERRPQIQRRSRPERRTSTGRKQRTIYGLKQTEVLEEAFHSQRYMVGAEREILATRLNLSEAQVRVWFQNRRSKSRKQCKATEAMEQQQMQLQQQQKQKR